MRACVRVWVRMCLCVCVWGGGVYDIERGRDSVCVRACVRACVGVSECVSVSVRACVCVCMCVWGGGVCVFMS